MNDNDARHRRPHAAQAALLLQRIQVDEIVVDEFSILATAEPVKSRSGRSVPSTPRYMMRAVIEREITHGEYLALTRPLLGTRLAKLAQAPSSVRDEYRREYDASPPGHDGPIGLRLFPHPDEADRLAQEIEAATVRIIA